MGMNSDLRSIKYKMDFQIFQIHFMYAILESFFYSILSELLFFYILLTHTKECACGG